LARDIAGVIVLGAGLVVLLYFLRLWLARTPYPLNGLELQIAEAVVVLVVGYAFAKALDRGVRGYMRQVRSLHHASGIGILVDIVVAILVFAGVFTIFGLSLESIFFGSAFLGIVIGFAGQTVLGNVFAGLTILFTHPFRVGDRIGLVSSSYGVLAPSYPHEMLYPHYEGIVQDIGLVYTVVLLEGGRLAEVANLLVLNALIINDTASADWTHRVRMTFPQSVPVQLVEDVLADPGLKTPNVGFTIDAARVEVTDISVASWDAVVVIRANEWSEGKIRDRILRRVLERLPAAQVVPAK
jgi:small-conductance mechanosensitive channel